MGWLAGQTPWLAGPTMLPLAGWLHDDTLQEAVEGNPMLKVNGCQTPWPAAHHLVCYLLNEVGNRSLDPYKYPPPHRWKSKQHTLLVVLHL
jgi:hypothetical protein